MDRRERLQRLERIAHLMDREFRMPGTGWRFGLDGLLGLIFGAGDLVTAVLGLYTLREAHKLGLSGDTKLKMAGNILADLVIGAIPLVGDLADFVFKAFDRNIRLIRAEVDRMDDVIDGTARRVDDEAA